MPLTEKEIIEKLLFKAQEMREAQKKYFSTRTQTWLKHAKLAEREFDEIINLFIELGYVTEIPKTDIQQKLL